MFKSKSGSNKIDSSATGTVIGDGIKIENGIVKGSGNIRVDGEILAEVEIKGSIIVGETGRITGDVKVDNALIAGKVDGNVVCDDSMHLTTTAAVTGNIVSSSLVVDEGARFSGNCQMAKQGQSNATNGPKPNSTTVSQE